MTIASERGAVQNPFLRYAVEAGWTYLSPDDALRLRPGPPSPVLFPVLVQQLQKLNPGVVDQRRAADLARAFCRVKPNVEGNLAAWEITAPPATCLATKAPVWSTSGPRAA